MPASELARAKVNLCLHVTGRRNDGYHLLDSLVVFPEIGDVLTAEPASEISLKIQGPFSEGLSTGADNLVIRAAEAISPPNAGVAIRLEKNLPVAAGIGGGSADAAAALRLLSRIWGVSYDSAVALDLGSDVPVCLKSETCRMSGVGEKLTDIPDLPEFWLLLINAGLPVSTGRVFGNLDYETSSPMPPMPDVIADLGTLVDWLGGTRNDLERAAVLICPETQVVLDILEQDPNCLFSGMSGSGGTCFGVFPDQSSAIAVQKAVSGDNPDWWVAVAPVKSTGKMRR